MFPLVFECHDVIEQVDSQATVPFIVGAMYTAGYRHQAKRLISSCEQFGLPYGIYQVPEVHRSISAKGGSNLAFTKANFIEFLLETYNRPVLYLDADCYIAQYPEKVVTMAEEGYDFSVYNWLADKHTESYVPVTIRMNTNDEPRRLKNRYYRFSHSIDYYSVDQLICSGCVQFYGNTQIARIILEKWHQTIEEFNGCADDQCLDYAFNNYISGNEGLKTTWLDKSYARYAWWIYVRPVINHPDMPDAGEGFQPIPVIAGKKRFYPELALQVAVDSYFPRDCIIDTKQMMLFRVQDRALVPAGRFSQEIWI